jgi:hypothetical protein
MDVAPPGFPASIRVASACVGGHATDLVVSVYRDGATVLIASQLGTVGTVIEAK